MKKIFLSLMLLPVIAFSKCDMPYDACEISEMIYSHYLDSLDYLSHMDTDSQNFTWMSGYNQACLNIYMMINLIE